MTTTYTPNLHIAEINPNQTDVQTTSNTAFTILDSAIGGFLSLSVAGSANVTLSDATITGGGQASNKVLEFTGVLTGSINVIVPTLARVYVISNQTTGAFTLTVKTASGTGIVVAQNSKAILYCDGTNVLLLQQCGGYPQNSQSGPYTLVASDAGKSIYHPSADTTARTWTIPANGSVPFPLGTEVVFINDSSAGTLTISITTDTLVLAGAGSTGSRTLAASGIAKAIKMTSTRWMISGTGLT